MRLSSPYQFEAPWHAFEFAFHILEVKANLVVLSMAWLTREDRSTFTPFPHEPDMETMTYWVQRLEPVIRSENEDEIIVVFANRCGIEDDVVYAGTSAVIGVKNGEVSVYGLLGRGVKELLIVNTDLPPFAKLVNRPVATPTTASDILSPTSELIHDKSPASIPESEPEPIAAPKIPSPPPAPTRTVRSRSKSTQREEPERGSLRRRGSPGPSPKKQRTSAAAASETRMTNVEEPSSAVMASEEAYEGCSGGCGGCDEHTSEGGRGDLTTPTCPSPTPMAVRPKLAISTGPETLPPLTTRPPPSGMEPGNFFTSRDLCTPPITPFDDIPMSTTRYHWNNPVSAFPASAAMHTPEEPIWPVFNGSTKIDFKRTPSRAPPSRPESRTEARESRTSSRAPSRAPSRAENRPESRPPSRPASRTTNRPASRQASRTREVKAEDVVVAGGNAAGDLISVAMVPSRPVSPKSRNVSPTREQTSPTASHQSFRSDPGRHLKRTKSLDHFRNSSIGDLASTQSRKDGKRDLIRRIEQLRAEKEESKDSNAILIAASPSVFETSFSKPKPAHAPRESEWIEAREVADHRTRSKSVSNSIPLFQYQGPEIPKSVRNASRGRQPTTTKRTGSTDLIDLGTNPKSNKATTLTHRSVHPDIQAMLITEDEAFRYAPRLASRTESRGRRRTPSRRADDGGRRRHSTEREEKGIMSPQDLVSPISI